MNGPLMVSASHKLISQVVFIVAGVMCLKLGEQLVAHALIFGALGSLVPVAEKAEKKEKETP